MEQTLPEEHPICRKWEEYLEYNDEETVEAVRAHWRKVPALAVLPENSKKVVELPVRRELMECMRRGVTVAGEPQRHALCPKELQYLMGGKIKLSNLYFHLKKLQEASVVKEVEVLSDGRYDTSFYGLAARFFIYERDQRFSVQGLRTLLKVRGGVEMEQRLWKFLEKVEEAQNEVVNWIETHHEELAESGVDEVQLFTTMVELHPVLSDQELRDEISRILQDSSP